MILYDTYIFIELTRRCSERRLIMDTARKDCIWYDQCGQECYERCDDYSPIGSSGQDEVFYRQNLKKNTEEYSKLIREFSGKGGDMA